MCEVVYFDVELVDDEFCFNGVWSIYFYFNFGKVIVSDIGRGFFVFNLLIDGFGVLEFLVNFSVEIVVF